MSRAEIARELGLTRTTVGYAIKELLDADLVHEPIPELSGANETSRIGRPSVGVSLNSTGAYFVGLDVSTTSLTAVLIDLTMAVVAKFSTSIGSDPRDVAAVTDQLAELAKRSIRATGKRRERVRGIGVSIPGLVGRDGRVAVAPFLEWRDVDLKTKLTERLGTDFNVRVCNDAVAVASAVCAAASETDISDLLLILMSEGIGSAIIRQGRVAEGFNGYAGEIGQMVMAPTVAPSTRQTFQLLAGHRFFAAFLPKDRPIVDGIVDLAGSKSLPPSLEKALEQWAAHLAAGFLNAIWLLDPERIVVAGVLAPLYPRVAARVDAMLRESMDGLRVPPIVVSKYGAEGAAVGAAAMIRETLFALPELAEAATEKNLA
jgi:predicted NBD/HSP70 family sugar kinase